MRPLTCCVAAVAWWSAGPVQAGPAPDVPLRDAAVCRAPDGAWYLTGTTNVNTLEPRHADFQNNDGVRLWRSKDLVAWDAVGLVWDLATDPPNRGARQGKMWQRYLRAVPGRPDMPWSHGVTAPELHHVKETYWIALAMNDQAVGLLRSTTGKAEGPYEEHCRLDNRHLGGDLSLLADGNDVYAVWGAGYVARMTDDMKRLAERPRSLQAAIEGFPAGPAAPDQAGERGAFLFQAKGAWFFVYAAWTRREGRGHFDTLICRGRGVYGPYGKPVTMVRDGGQATVFGDAEGDLHASFSRADRPVVAALEWQDGLPVVREGRP